MCLIFITSKWASVALREIAAYSLENGQKITRVGLPFLGAFVSALLELLII